MRRIYSTSFSTIVWLGDVPIEDHGSCFALFNWIRTQSPPLHSRSATKSLKGVARCIDLIFDSPWFGRSWTAQEAILSPRLVFMLGPASATLDEMCEVEGLADNRKSRQNLPVALTLAGRDHRIQAMLIKRLQSIPSSRALFHGIRDVRDQRQRQGPVGAGVTLLQALQRYRDRQCSDPRDKIYALLGIINEWQNYPPIVADYTIGEGSVLARIVFELARREKSLAFLPLVGLPQDRRDGAPTWAPPALDHNCLDVEVEHVWYPPNLTMRLIDNKVLHLRPQLYGKVTAIYQPWGSLPLGTWLSQSERSLTFFYFMDLLSHLGKLKESPKARGRAEGPTVAKLPGLIPGHCTMEPGWSYYSLKEGRLRDYKDGLKSISEDSSWDPAECWLTWRERPLPTILEIDRCLLEAWVDAWLSMPGNSSASTTGDFNMATKLQMTSGKRIRFAHRVSGALVMVLRLSTDSGDEDAGGQCKDDSAKLVTPPNESLEELFFMTDLGVYGVAPRVKPGDVVYFVPNIEEAIVVRPLRVHQVSEPPYTLDTHTLIARVIQLAKKNMERHHYMDSRCEDVYLL